LLQKKKMQQMASTHQKQAAAPVPAPIAAFNALKKAPTTLSGQPIGPDTHLEEEFKGGKGVAQKAPATSGQQPLAKVPSTTSVGAASGLQNTPTLAQRTSARDKK
jgi:hypothetical protein